MLATVGPFRALGGGGGADITQVYERNQDATLYIGNLDPQVDDDLLWELFIQCGPVRTVSVPRDKLTGNHQGYGFVEFTSEVDADYALKLMNMVKLYGKPLRLNKSAQDRRHFDVGANIFLGNLDPDVDEKTIYDTFASFGNILSVKVMRDPETGISRGFGFISYDTFEASDAALAAMNGQFICNRPIHVSYAYKKDTRGERHGSAAERLLAANRPQVANPNAPVSAITKGPPSLLMSGGGMQPPLIGGVGVASGGLATIPNPPAGGGIPAGAAQQPFSPPFSGPQGAGGGPSGAPAGGAGPSGGGVTGTASGGMMRMGDLPPLPLPPSIAGGLPNLPMGLPPPPLLFMPRPGMPPLPPLPNMNFASPMGGPPSSPSVASPAPSSQTPSTGGAPPPPGASPSPQGPPSSMPPPPRPSPVRPVPGPGPAGMSPSPQDMFPGAPGGGMMPPAQRASPPGVTPPPHGGGMGVRPDMMRPPLLMSPSGGGPLPPGGPGGFSPGPPPPRPGMPPPPVGSPVPGGLMGPHQGISPRPAPSILGGPPPPMPGGGPMPRPGQGPIRSLMRN
ncbi:rna recognition motif-containing protein [Cystoisospora suis]|uniref:Splicing factor 3B subunit 4 n=1 Tax=Cystoisospora suis TaxID=483139 RepID=A0A2C6KP94_9APIC|nr:rna recognition motif-containing protein [Cystoisospora suis]